MKEDIEYDELKKVYPNTTIPYSELLRTKEWKLFREKILKRDNYRCCRCNNLATETSSDGKFTAFEVLVVPEYDVEHIELVYQDRYYQLHAHHKYYISSKLPWEYKIESLITLCQYCHEEIHKMDSTVTEFWDIESIKDTYRKKDDFESENPF